MTDLITGGCRCGAVRFSIVLGDLPPVYACHCHICQRATGSAFSLQALVPEARLTVTGPVIVREIVIEDRTSVQRFCGTCYARVYNTNTGRPGLAVVRAGALDRSEEIECRAHIYTATKQRWFVIPVDTPSWPDSPDDSFVTVMTRPAR